VLVGGSGVVGRSLAPLLAKAQLAGEIVVAGRDPARAQPVLDAVRSAGASARFERIVLGEQAHGPPVPASLVIGLVNDPADALLAAAMSAGVPFVDVTRWTSRMAVTVARVATARPSSPVVLASGWMGGLLARVAAHLVALAGDGAVVDGAIRYALADASGEDSVDYMDRLWLPFEVPEAQGSVVIEPFRDRRRVLVHGRRTSVARFDTPEQWTLPVTLGVQRAAVRLGFDNDFAGALLFTLVRAGFFRLVRSDRFRSLRRSLLRSSGAEKRSGAATAFRVDVRGDGGAHTMTVHSDLGQSALTAVGALLSARWALGMPAAGGVFFPEQDPDNAHLPKRLAALGVGVTPEES
jgi:saccharopine dehydrogenase-like NADP-dependent oxidoreductase